METPHAMKRIWDIEELVEHFTLLPQDMDLLANKTGSTRLGFAVLLKYFQYEARFPIAKQDVPKPILTYLANQLNLAPELYLQYDWTGRTITYHRAQIREHFAFRETTMTDAEEMTAWLISTQLASDQNLERLKALVIKRFREQRVEPPRNDRLERLIRSACHTYEQTLFAETLQKLPQVTRERFDALLTHSVTAEEIASPKNEEGEAPAAVYAEISLHDLKTNPGPVGLESVMKEIAKLRLLDHFALPTDLFSTLSPKVLSLYRQRAAAEPPRELRRHPEAVRYTELSAFCWQRRQEIIDGLIDLLLLIVHKIGAKAEKHVTKELVEEVRRVEGKERLLCEVAEAALAKPDDTVREVIYKVADEQKLKDIVKEYKAKGNAYREQVHTRMRASYRNHYRRMVPLLVTMLEFRSNNKAHRPVVDALTLIKRYAESSAIYYPSEEEVPLEGVVRPMWQELVVEKDKEGERRVNRVNYELCVLEALREKLRCREVWVVGANKYRNPDDDLPQDFETQREVYYRALGQPLDAEEFVRTLQQQMMAALEAFDRTLPKNPNVRLLEKKGGWIALSPLSPQEEPTHLVKLKAEITKRWSMTSLLDMLKETDLRVDFTKHFKSSASRETLERETLRKRLLLCLYGLGTNTGLKRVSAGDHGEGYNDLLYVRSRFLHKEDLRNAIAEVANAIFRSRQAHIWGEATTTCASDSKQFGAYDQNLMTEWHARYGGRGIMIYWHVEKHSVCIYSQLKTCSSSEVAAMIEGVLRHCTDMAVKQQFVDSHGQSEIAFGFCHLLGFELMPRLKTIHSQRLYRPQAGDPAAYPNLQLILTRPINWDLIRQQYDQMIKYATALRLGTAETEAILRRFTRTGLQHPVYQAFAELGKVIKTTFLCRYLQSEALRQEIHEGLNTVESWNAVNHFIFYGREGEFATNNVEAQEIAALALHLLQISLVFINTLLIQRVLADPKQFQKMKPEDWRALTPLIYSHVNPYGMFRLDMKERMRIEDEEVSA
jgi:TnpA family transposase